MSTFELFVLGLALALDSFSVTISNSIVYPHETRARLMLMPIAFGVFQAGMPVLGYVLSGLAAELIQRYSGIVAMVILGIIGGNMVREGVATLRSGEQSSEKQGRLGIGAILIQAVATAIDAFAVGIELRAADVVLLEAVSIIGVTTFACCVVALAIGRRVGERLGNAAEVVGGIVLICIGLKQLLS